jgi:hypothetical protein
MITVGEVWLLHSTDRVVARLVVTGAEDFWMHASVEALPGFEEVRPLFEEQEATIEDRDFDEVLYHRIREAVTMSFPGGEPVPEFLLYIAADGTAAWRWAPEPFEEEVAG